jgi:hypothetical protein
MDFDINKYDDVKFHENEETNKKIKALLLWFDYEVERRRMSPTNQLKLIDNWISTFEKKELYEVIPEFKNRRLKILEDIENGVKIKPIKVVPVIKEKVVRTKSLFGKIKIFINSLFNRN